MADNLYQPGDSVPLTATFKDANGNPADPTSVTLTVGKPDGTSGTRTPLVHTPGTGIYSYNEVPDATYGVWWYTFKGTGTIAQVAQGTFVVQALQTDAAQLSSAALISLADAREYVLGSIADNSQDAKLMRRINEISAAIKAYTRREWLPVVTESRVFYYRGRGIINLVDSDLQTATSLTAFTNYPTSFQQPLSPGTTTVISDYRFGPSGGMPPARTYRWVDISNLWRWTVWQPPYYEGFEVTIAGTWGIGVIPDDVKLAVKIALRDSVENPEGAAQRTLGPLSYSEPLEQDVPDSRWRALPAESRALLSEYRDDPIVVAA